MDARLVAARLPGLAMYGSPYAAPNFPSYLSYGPAAAAVAAATDPASLYPPMGPGDNADAWRAGLSQAAAYYDPAVAAHYGYGYGPMALSDGARRKNATRETTSTLKAWLNEHRKNPYPTKGEKIMLAIITKMTLTQVSTWFANARRRLKKENKMTWSPRNRCGEDDEDDDDLTDEGLHSNHNRSSRSSSPLDMPQSGLASNGSERRLNGHTSGGESLSDEGASYSDGRDFSSQQSINRSDAESKDKKEEKISPVFVPRPPSNDASRIRVPSAHLARHHPYATSSSSPGFSGLRHNLSPPVQTSIARPGLPFPGTVPPHLSVAAQPSPMLHPGMPGQFNPAAFLAASRGHPLPPHIMAALSEQAQLHQYQQALQQLPIHPFLSSPSDAKNRSNPSPSSSSTSQVSTVSPPTSTTNTNSSPAVTSPTKQKIWSIADVATSSDTSKSTAKQATTTEIKQPSQSPQSDFHPYSDLGSPKDVPTVRTWFDNMLQQQKLAAAAMSGQNGLANGVLPQHFQQLASGFTTSANHIPSNGARAPQLYPGLAEFMAAQEKANVAMREMGRNCEGSAQDGIETASLSSSHRSPDAQESDKNHKYASSPAASYHGESAESYDK
ncbi:uncharacterized protein LOC143452948 [Clavelina lepadiformis]|uniref:uncharacterized protein LOC143452948 n=1 Tax=Clavelina lepadiformis TaxID=159417 RepID=UPI0040418CCF